MIGRLDDTSLIWEPWLRNAAARPDSPALVHRSYGKPSVVWTWSELAGAAAAVAERLLAEGVKPGDVCATLLRHGHGFYPIYLGIVLAGAIPTVLAYPNPRLHPDKFRSGLQGMVDHSGFDWMLVERGLLGALGSVADAAGTRYRGMHFPYEWPQACKPETTQPVPPALTRRAQTDPDQPCLLQHSSGTTGLQKPVALSHRAVLEHARRYGAAIAANDADRVVSWLPLYHDMGLIAAFHLPLALGIPVVQLDPFEWVRLPIMMLQVLSEERGTLAWLPNFAYNLMAERADDDDLEALRLDAVRLLVNCSEPVRDDSHERFLQRFAPTGLRAETLGACYAMAEATFAVTQTEPGRRAPVVHAVRSALAAGCYEAATHADAADVRSYVSSGRPIAGVEVRIVGPDGSDLSDGAVGEVFVRSAYLFDGYRNQPAKTAEVLVDGWYHTGDLAFRLDGEHFIIGRHKDLIISAGKNLYPEDIEAVVMALPGVVPGRVVAVGLENAATGTEDVCVIAETNADPTDHRALKRSIVTAGMGIDVTISRVELVPPRWLVKTSSGKPCRRSNRERVLPPAKAAEPT